jgi:hypothetical protein
MHVYAATLSYCLPIELQLLRDAGDAAGGENNQLPGARRDGFNTALNVIASMQQQNHRARPVLGQPTPPTHVCRCRLTVGIQQRRLQFRSLFSVPENRPAYNWFEMGSTVSTIAGLVGLPQRS